MPRKLAALALSAVLAATSVPGSSSAEPAQPLVAAAPELSIPFEKWRLPNGLTVVLAPDRTVPVVTVNTLVDVGSRHETRGRTGFAHLFEHLMFMGTERVPTGAFDAWMEAEGGWNNAWTSNDRTDYFDVAPSHVLPLLLWLEADRFSSLSSAMTLEKLEAQRKVVRNERRQTSENQPYGKARLRLPELLYPSGHPYHHPVIGSHEDLEAASVDDVKRFFEEFYVPSNATLVVAGDFEVEATKRLVERTLGQLPAAEAPVAPPPPPTPKLSGVVRETMVDDVELAKLVLAWHAPAHFAPGDAELDVLAAVLDQGKSSRLYKALVYDEQLAQSVHAAQVSQELSSYFTIEIVARKGTKLDRVEKVVLDVLAKLRAEGPTRAEVERAKVDFEASFVHRLESVHDRASLLALYESALGDPGYLERDLERYRTVDEAAVKRVAGAVLDPGAFVALQIHPRRAAEADAASKGAKR
jgi:predicted Zn-dependent peptidase